MLEFGLKSMDFGHCDFANPIAFAASASLIKPGAVCFSL
jgi:hypothetical protein